MSARACTRASGPTSPRRRSASSSHLLVVERADQQLAAAQLDRPSLRPQPPGERLELGLILGLDEHEVLRALLVGARVLDDLAAGGVEPRVALLVPARDAHVGGQPVGLEQLAHDALGLARRRLGRGVDVEPRAVARHDRAAPEPLARLVVEVVRAQPLAERVAVLLVVEVDLDAPFLIGKRGHEGRLAVASSRTPAARRSGGSPAKVMRRNGPAGSAGK